MLYLKDFSVSAASLVILKDISLHVKAGQLIIIGGDNGSGKSTLACALIGLSGYETAGRIFLNNQDISSWPVEKRAQAGMFLAFQQPVEVPGLPITTFLHHAYRSRNGGSDLSMVEINKKIEEAFQQVGLPKEYSKRNVHEGFSGGQKKRFELVQMLVLEPQIIILDEPDSGLDAQGITALIGVVDQYRVTHPQAIFIIITHNMALVKSLNPDVTLTMAAGMLL